MNSQQTRFSMQALLRKVKVSVALHVIQLMRHLVARTV